MDGFAMIMAFPFEQIGEALRALSVSGTIGNGAALVLYVFLCLLPAVWGLYRKEYPLCGLSVILFPVLYCMANLPTGEEMFLPVWKAMLGGLSWSGIVCVCVLKLLKLFKAGRKEQLFGYARILLYVLGVLFAGALLSSACNLIPAIHAAGGIIGRMMEVVHFLSVVLPYGMDILVIVFACKLVRKVLMENRAETEAAANELASLSCICLAVITILQVCLNALQLLFLSKLSNVHVSVEIPFISLAFVLAVFLTARLVAENRRLADDNDLFI